MYRIFIVEDDAAIAQAVCEQAASWALEARCVTDFRRVAEEAAAYDPHLILLDISLPFFDGYHWCRQIRKSSRVPIIFLSSAADNINIVMAINMGADDFIAKPFDPNVLLAKVQALLAPCAGARPMRSSNGFDYNRASMLLAVLEKRGSLKVSQCDAYLNIIGGLTLDEPAADLAAVVAIASSYLDKPVPSTMAAIGEVGLSGEIRSITHMEQRLSEVKRLGFTQCMVPAHKVKDLKAPVGLELLPVANISRALQLLARGQ